MSEKIDASPTKEFFISMITRDISLVDCILDLLDNSLDGARAQANLRTALSLSALTQADGERPLSRYAVALTVSKDRFAIEDNCGGMSIDTALHYAFHFGRPADQAQAPQGGIGLYGIGMKRAMFKIGRQIIVQSSTNEEGFDVAIDVDEWAATDKWEFPLERRAPAEIAGTSIEITSLQPGVDEEFGDRATIDSIKATIARDYTLFLLGGFSITVNGEAVRPLQFNWLAGDEFAPLYRSFPDSEEQNVKIEVLAGASTQLADEESPEDLQRIDPSLYGWFVACNGRVVLAGNKDARTVWGDETFPGWHPQYYGFTGFVHFVSADPKLLPWTTTKRDVDSTTPIYRRAVVLMKEVTRPFIAYTNARKADVEAAKAREQAARQTQTPVTSNTEMRLPTLVRIQTVRVANIAYQVTFAEYERAAQALGNRRMARKDVGLRTFEYFVEREVGDAE